MRFLNWRREDRGGPEVAVAFLGPLYRVDCTDSPGDVAAVRAVETPRRKVVIIDVADSGETARIVLHPSEARRFAAGILNTADDCDGIQPMFSRVDG